MTLRRWNPAGLCGPLLSDLLHRHRAHFRAGREPAGTALCKSAARSWRTDVRAPDLIGFRYVKPTKEVGIDRMTRMGL